MSEPRYWMHETSGVLRPAVEAYLAGEQMTEAQVATMRAYLRQWIASPYWAVGLPGDHRLSVLRAWVDDLSSRESIRLWLETAEMIGIDPL